VKIEALPRAAALAIQVPQTGEIPAVRYQIDAGRPWIFAGV